MSSPKRFLLPVIFLLFRGILLYSQEKAVNRDKYRIHIVRTGEIMKTDGVLDEECWQDAEVAGSFIKPQGSVYFWVY
jgi:hypothetical protein